MHRKSGPQIHIWKHNVLNACVTTTMPMDITKTLPAEATALNKRHNTCFIEGVSIKLCCLSRIKQQWRPYFALNENRSLGYCKLLQLLRQRSTHNEGCAPLLKLWTVLHTSYSSYYHIFSVHNSCTAYIACNCNVIPQPHNTCNHQSVIKQIRNFNHCFSVHFDKYKTIFANKCTVY